MFEEFLRAIQRTYADLGHTRGWRFLTVPRRTFEAQPDIALITLNPGGEGPGPLQGEASCEDGCAYRTESWDKPAGESTLQVQVLKLLEHLRLRLCPDIPRDDFVDHKVLGAFYVPFRSPSLSALINPQESLEFARSLWTQILALGVPRLIVTIDRLGFAGIRNILTENFSMSILYSQAFPTGWGHCTANVTRCVSGRGDLVTILRLPHLSTYKLFSREKCLPYLKVIMDHAINQETPRNGETPIYA